MNVKVGLGKDLKELVNSITGADLISAKVLADISVTIFKERLKRDMTQKEFADFMGVSQGMVSKWESDNYNFTIETLSSICDKLGFDLEIKMENLEDKYKYADIENQYLGWSIKTDIGDLRGIA